MQHTRVRTIVIAACGVIVLASGGAASAAADKMPAGKATRTEVYEPLATAVDEHGDVYVTDPALSAVYKVTPSGWLSTIAGNGIIGAPRPGPATASPLNLPAGVAVDTAGDVYVTDGTRLLKIDPAGVLSVAATGLNRAQGIAVDQAGDVYVADLGRDLIVRVTPSGAKSVVAGTGLAGTPVPGGTATSSPLDTPDDVAVDAAGNLYIADAGNHEVEKVDTSGTLSVVAGQKTKLRGVYGLASDPQGDLYVSLVGPKSGSVKRIDATSGRATLVAGSSDTDDQPAVVVSGSATEHPILAGEPSLDSQGDLYIPDLYNNVVEKVTPSGHMTLFAGQAWIDWTRPPTLHGVARVGRRLRVEGGSWDVSGVKRTRIRWYTLDAKMRAHTIKGADGPTLRLTRALRGQTVYAAVTVTKAGYMPSTVRSDTLRVR